MQFILSDKEGLFLLLSQVDTVVNYSKYIIYYYYFKNNSGELQF